MAGDAEDIIEKGVTDFKGGNFLEALSSFREIDPLKKSPLIRSCEAYCIAVVDGNLREAVAAGVEAVRRDPKNSEIYLNLGKIHILAGQKKAAIHVLKLGLRTEKNFRIIDELAALGIRRPPPLPFLPRESFINKQLGLLLRKFGLR